MNLLLHLTERCNLACHYCFAPAGSSRVMSPEVGRAAADLCLAHAARSGERAILSFFGGEPMLAFETLREVVEYASARAREQKVPCLFRMNSNGTLISDQHLAWFEQHGLRFTLSLDGDQTMHDSQRVDHAGRGSFGALEARFDAFLGFDPALEVSLVVTPRNLEQLASGLGYLFERGFHWLTVRPDVLAAWDRGAIAELRRQYLLVADDYLRRLRRGDELYLNLFDDKWRSATSDAGRSGCDAGGRRLSVAPGGELYPCVRWVGSAAGSPGAQLGDVWRGLDGAAVAALRAQVEAPKQPCVDCAYRERCSHDCACEQLSATGGLQGPAPALCEHERVLIPIADGLGNLLWREQNPAFLRKQYAGLLAPPGAT
ncbi:MAG: SPASM domain-containing protein [Deltaproteobacteria bacterium]|nr:SPASM domain-containing protein [Deltaproteobacteria bacterium]